jgi:hypothetical protein
MIDTRINPDFVEKKETFLSGLVVSLLISGET